MFSLYPCYHKSEGEGERIAFLTLCPKWGKGVSACSGEDAYQSVGTYSRKYCMCTYSNLVIILGNKINTK